MPIQPIDIGDVEVMEPPTGERKPRRCTPAVRQFMSNALRELEKDTTSQTALSINAGEEPTKHEINVPIQRFEILGLEANPYIIASALNSCPESEYINIIPEEDVIKLVKIGEPEVKPVKHYNPKFHEEN